MPILLVVKLCLHPYLLVLSLSIALQCLAGCSEIIPDDRSVLRVAVTTSTRDTGLLDVLVPLFEMEYGVRVDVIAVGTGKALRFGENGDVDVVLVHARDAELEFVRAGHGMRREDVMYNHFEILGPESDPAGIRGMNASAALNRIVSGGHGFVSRGDESGTHQRERMLWEAVGSPHTWDGYVESGQGMGRTLLIADQMQAYTISDRGTYLAFKDKIELRPLTTRDSQMRNPYGVITVNPAKSTSVNYELADRFVDFLIGAEGQRVIREFRVAGTPVFHPHYLEDPDTVAPSASEAVEGAVDRIDESRSQQPARFSTERKVGALARFGNPVLEFARSLVTLIV